MLQQQILWLDRFLKTKLRLAKPPPSLKKQHQGLEQTEPEPELEPELEPEPEPEPEQLWLRCE